ncbi:CheR family methyltransferase [Paraburkholderia megapolitana]|uniref:CheR family methyltransferase n=1 Tax=Paraburkholderia megapolitana TaxID=420953 RepID=UPI0038B98F9F
MTATADFPIVGVGASAGAVEALEGFFRGMPDRPGLACVIVTHLSPDRESMLPEIVARYTSMQVHSIVDGADIQIDSVYLLSGDAILGIRNRSLQVRRQHASRRERRPIDVFFSELATDVGELAAGIVLSGGDSDGTLGVKAIKERGGLTLAQAADGFGPHQADMPESAISAGLVDFAVPVEHMGAKLVDFARGPRLQGGLMAEGDEAVEPSRLDEVREEIHAILRHQVGHDFSGYKTGTFLQRVQRRMRVSQIDTPEGYVKRLAADPQEVTALFRDLLINVTSFFRDADAFESLADLVLPDLFKQRSRDDVVRVWVPGCATGEEAYSIAILLRERLDGMKSPPRIQVFSTDIDDRALAVARAARYPPALLDGVSQTRRERFFVADGACYVIAKEVRDLCIFSPHSVIGDPPFSRIDLISCRNLLIYFGAGIQKQVIPAFHYALRPAGYLFLGTSEDIGRFDDLFMPVEKKHRIFRRRDGNSPHAGLPPAISTLWAGHLHELAPGRPHTGGTALRRAIDHHVLERFSPPHALVTRNGDVVYYSSRTGKYLEAAAGAPTRQLVAMARRGLGLDLRTAFRESVESGSTVTRDGIVLESEGGRMQTISVTVDPLPEETSGEPQYLVVFVDQGPLLKREEVLARAQTTQDGAAIHAEKELADTRQRLQSTIEKYETSLGELKSSNEELLSVNEELQSSNEELETSKEELVSLNEELNTVNLELGGKIEALDRSNSDLRNLFESASVATVFLDRHLAIRLFTPAMESIYQLRSSDCGRPITELASRLALPDFQEDVATVFASEQPRERRVDSADGSACYLVRFTPYRDSDRKTDGVVIAFVDITGLVRAEERQQVLIVELQHRTRNLLSVVQSIAQHTFQRGPPLDTFIGRLSALGRLQGLVGAASDEMFDLGEIVRLELDSLGVADSDRVTARGPPVGMGSRNIQTFALVLHELATNAVKYGALRDDAARLDITWRVETGERAAALVFDWRENGLKTPPDSSRTGFGRQLIEKALRFTLHATTELTFGADGIACHIEIPIPSQVSDGGSSQSQDEST